MLGGCGDDDAGPTGTADFFTTENSVGRRGSYFLPSGYERVPLPVALLYHATNGSGASMVNAFATLAQRHRFIIVAPDSRIAPDGRFAWEVGNAPGLRTEDFSHTMALLDELEALPDVVVDWQATLGAGHSGGGAMAAYLATNDDRFDAFAVLHGGIIEAGTGDNVIRGWFSTGEDDDLRSPDHVQGQVDSAVALGFEDITYRVYPGGHGLSALERSELVEWWLAP